MGGWAIFWMAVVLKIPIIALLWLVWWAIRSEPAPAGDDAGGDGGVRPRPHPRRRPPRPPRRGPHAEPAPVPPKRVRITPRRHVPSHR
jgi:hypothetical protein